MKLVLTGTIKEVRAQIYDLIGWYGENARLVDVVEYERSL